MELVIALGKNIKVNKSYFIASILLVALEGRGQAPTPAVGNGI